MPISSKDAHITGCCLCRDGLGVKKGGRACTCSYRFHSLTGRFVVLVGGLNVYAHCPNANCPVSSVVERIGLVCYADSKVAMQ